MASFMFRPSGLNLSALIRPAVGRALQQTADEIGKRAADTAPFATGRLAHSVNTAVDAAGRVAAVGFTDSKAVAAHEEMHAHLDGGKRPKFLELALHENRDVLAATAAAELRGVLR